MFAFLSTSDTEANMNELMQNDGHRKIAGKFLRPMKETRRWNYDCVFGM
jgi:hypothetical protein